MNQRRWTIVISLTLAVLFWLGDHIDAADFTTKAGGLDFTFPAPVPEFEEAGDQLRSTVFELLVPSANRLVGVYLPVAVLQGIKDRKEPPQLSSYAMIQVPRRAEYTDASPAAFAQVLQGLNSSMGKPTPSGLGDVQDELDARLKSLNIERIEIGAPQSLGELFRKPDANGFAMLSAIKQSDRTMTMAMGMVVMRVKNRVFFAYLYREYTSPETVRWIKTTIESWSDEIAAKNK